MSKGKVTRDHILQQAFQMASESGLESLTIGELAKVCGMSKSGLFAHFNSKRNLQLAVLQHANAIFSERVIAPARALGDEDIESKLNALLDNWMTWNHSFQGSCMFLDAWNDSAQADCPLQKALGQSIDTWLSYMAIQVRKGQANGEFKSDLDAEQAAFEMYGLYLSAHVFYSLRGKEQSHRLFWSSAQKLMQSWKSLSP